MAGRPPEPLQSYDFIRITFEPLFLLWPSNDNFFSLTFHTILVVLASTEYVPPCDENNHTYVKVKCWSSFGIIYSLSLTCSELSGFLFQRA